MKKALAVALLSLLWMTSGAQAQVAPDEWVAKMTKLTVDLEDGPAYTEHLAKVISQKSVADVVKSFDAVKALIKSKAVNSVTIDTVVDKTYGTSIRYLVTVAHFGEEGDFYFSWRFSKSELGWRLAGFTGETDSKKGFELLRD